MVFVCVCGDFRQLTYIKESCDGEIWGDGVAALTTEERTKWAQVRTKIALNL